MVQVARTSSCFRRYALRKGSWHLGHWLHYGWTHGWPAAVPRRLRSRLAVRYSKSVRSPPSVSARGVLSKYSLLRIEIPRHLASWNSGSKVCTCDEWNWNWLDEGTLRNGSLLEVDSKLSSRAWVLRRPAFQGKWLRSEWWGRLKRGREHRCCE